VTSCSASYLRRIRVGRCRLQFDRRVVCGGSQSDLREDSAMANARTTVPATPRRPEQPLRFTMMSLLAHAASCPIRTRHRVGLSQLFFETLLAGQTSNGKRERLEAPRGNGPPAIHATAEPPVEEQQHGFLDLVPDLRRRSATASHNCSSSISFATSSTSGVKRSLGARSGSNRRRRSRSNAMSPGIFRPVPRSNAEMPGSVTACPRLAMCSPRFACSS